MAGFAAVARFLADPRPGAQAAPAPGSPSDRRAGADLPSPRPSAFSPGLSDALIAKPSISALIPPGAVKSSCDGVVEVFRRPCCIRPGSSRTACGAGDILEGLIPCCRTRRKVHWPPRPHPPIRRGAHPVVREGRWTRPALNARAIWPPIAACLAPKCRLCPGSPLPAQPFLLRDAVKVARASSARRRIYICWREPLLLPPPVLPRRICLRRQAEHRRAGDHDLQWPGR